MNTFFFHLTQRIETFDQEIWLKELNHVSKKDSKNVTLYKRLIELNLFLWTSSQYDSKSWSLFFNMTRRIEPFLFSNMTQRIELFFQNAQGIEPLFRMNYFFTWLELNSSLINTTQRVEFFTKNDSKCWTPFWIWLKELNLFCTGLKELNFFQPFDSKNGALFCMSPKLNFFLKNTIPKNDSKNWTFSKHDSQNRIPLKRKRLKEMNPFLFFFSTMTERIELFVNDSLNWASFMNLFSIRVEFFFFWLKELNFFWIWLKESNPIFLNWLKNWNFWLKKSKMKLFNFFENSKLMFFHMTRRIEPAFFNMTQRIELFFEFAQSFFWWTRRIEPFFFSIRLNESNPF